MATSRIERVNELLHREIGEALYRVIRDPGFDMSAVTVTHVLAHRNLRQAKVFVSIRGHEGDRERMLGRIRRRRGEIQRMINRDLTLKYTPRLTFELDPSIERAHHVLDVLAEIEREADDGAGGETEAGAFGDDRTGEAS